jgi:DnaJ like chaperone protein
MLGKLAQADGVVSEDEIARVTLYIDQTLKLDAKTKSLAIGMFHKGAASPLEFRDYAEQFGQEFKDRVNLTEKLLKVLLEVSAADGVLSPEEDELIYSASLLLGFSNQGYLRLKKKLEIEVPTIH